jgi:hypothetical protein
MLAPLRGDIEYMAKKSRSRKSSKRKRSQRRPARRAANRTPAAATASAQTQSMSGRPGSRPRAEVDFAQQYSYVYRDLKKVALIAAAMVVILVVLAFVLA